MSTDRCAWGRGAGSVLAQSATGQGVPCAPVIHPPPPLPCCRSGPRCASSLRSSTAWWRCACCTSRARWPPASAPRSCATPPPRAAGASRPHRRGCRTRPMRGWARWRSERPAGEPGCWSAGSLRHVTAAWVKLCCGGRWSSVPGWRRGGGGGHEGIGARLRACAIPPAPGACHRAAMESVETLFWKAVPVVVRRGERGEERPRQLTVRLLAAGGKQTGARVRPDLQGRELDPPPPPPPPAVVSAPPCRRPSTTCLPTIPSRRRCASISPTRPTRTHCTCWRWARRSMRRCAATRASESTSQTSPASSWACWTSASPAKTKTCPGGSRAAGLREAACRLGASTGGSPAPAPTARAPPSTPQVPGRAAELVAGLWRRCTHIWRRLWRRRRRARRVPRG